MTTHCTKLPEKWKNRPANNIATGFGQADEPTQMPRTDRARAEDTLDVLEDLYIQYCSGGHGTPAGESALEVLLESEKLKDYKVNATTGALTAVKGGKDYK